MEWDAPYRGLGALGEAEDEALNPGCCLRPAEAEIPCLVSWRPAREAGRLLSVLQAFTALLVPHPVDLWSTWDVTWGEDLGTLWPSCVSL